MNEVLPKEMRKTVTNYMKQYAKECGWKVKVTFSKGYVELAAASIEASSASKKP